MNYVMSARLLALLDLDVELVQVVEHLKVLILILDEQLHELVDVRDARRRLPDVNSRD